MKPEAKRRVQAAITALSVYAAGSCATTTPEPHVGTHELERLDYARPKAQDTPESFVVPPRRGPSTR